MEKKEKYIYDQYTENRYKRNNIILQKPKGFIIMDTYNNKFFPIDTYTVDTMSFNTDKVTEIFHELYGGSKRDLFLPWHYIIDTVNERPYVVNTRPWTYKSGFQGYENYLTIMLIGDSNKDIYPGTYYKQIANMIINQFFYLQQHHIQDHNNIVYWTGKNFRKTMLEKELQM